MISVLNNILYYLNLAALLQSQHENSYNFTTDNNSTLTLPLVQQAEDNITTILPPILVKQIPPGPIVPGVVVKFVCSVDEVNNASDSGGCIDAANNNSAYNIDGLSYQWEMHQYLEDKEGNVSNTNVVQLPGQDSEMEMEFNESIANPKANCDLVCTIKNNPRPSRASIKLHFVSKDRKMMKLSPPANFKMLDITSRAVYFSWSPSNQVRKEEDELAGIAQPEITGYIIEYKNGKGTYDWRHERVSRYEIKKPNTHAVCIMNLIPWTTYHFRIMSCSKNATSSPSLPIIVRTMEECPSAPPLDVKMEVVDQKRLKVSWKPPPRSSWNGALLGYNIGLKRGSSPDDEPYDIYVFSPLETLGNIYSSQITVPDLSTPYKVVVQAFNNIGVGPFSKPVTQTQPNTNTEEE